MGGTGRLNRCLEEVAIEGTNHLCVPGDCCGDDKVIIRITGLNRGRRNRNHNRGTQLDNLEISLNASVIQSVHRANAGIRKDTGEFHQEGAGGDERVGRLVKKKQDLAGSTRFPGSGPGQDVTIKDDAHHPFPGGTC